MNLALCYQNVLPSRGGCETYLVDLARRLAADGHEVHLYASRWDSSALPRSIQVHPVPMPECLRFRRPWLFGAACLRQLRRSFHQVTVGFDKTWGQDVLYPQGGLHLASAEHNLLTHRGPLRRHLARMRRWLEPAYWSFSRLERRQYLGTVRPLVVVNSRLVQQHFQRFYGIAPEHLRLVPNAIDPGRFVDQRRPELRAQWRQRWGLGDYETVGVFAAMNYPLKGLVPLLHAVRLLPDTIPLRLVVVGNPRTGPYQRLARRLGIASRVRFVGFCADMRHAYFGADFLVHPTFYDPCSLVVLEALACGLPIITSSHNGASELLEPPREGFVIDDPHDHRQLAECLSRMADSQVRSACAEAARRAAERWTFEDHYRRLLEVFTEAARRKRAA